MDRNEIITALTALGRRLAARGVTGELYVVGGAAIALAFDRRRSTRDIDAVFEPKMTIYEEAEAVAEDLALLAHRVGEDESDVRLLATALSLTDAAQVLRVAEDVFGDRLDPGARFFVEEIFADSDA